MLLFCKFTGCNTYIFLCTRILCVKYAVCSRHPGLAMFLFEKAVIQALISTKPAKKHDFQSICLVSYFLLVLKNRPIKSFKSEKPCKLGSLRVMNKHRKLT